MKYLSSKFVCAIAASLISFAGVAADLNKTAAQIEKEKGLKEVQDRVQATFQRMKVDKFSETVVPGLYEIIAGDKTIFYHPDTANPQNDVLIFGEMYSKDGRSISREHVQNIQVGKLDKIPLDIAIRIGNGPNEIIEFTDPECPYCHAFHKFIQARTDVTRLVMFSPIDSHIGAPKKAVHIMCSADKAKAMDDVFNNRVTNFTACAEGEALLQKHRAAAAEFGVGGTPTLIVKREIIVGFNKPKLEEALKGNSEGLASAR